MPAQGLAGEGTVKILVAGDVMGHERIKLTALKNGDAQEHYFGSLLEQIHPVVANADLAFVNLETPVSATESVKPQPFVFNAPQDLLKGLKWIGFRILSVANNHALDQRQLGLKETIAAVRQEGLTPIGADVDRETSLKGSVTEIRGIKVGFLAFTALVNGGTHGDEETPYLNLTERHQDLVDAIKDMKKRADVVLLSLHWGVEYEPEPRPWQVKLAEEVHRLGVDVIVGHHPHVLQPIRWHKGQAGRNQLTLYSLGNLISNQSASYLHKKTNLDTGRTRDGALVELHVGKNGVESFRVIPTWTDNWQGPEDGIRTIRITEELRRLDSEIRRLKPSPERTFLLERQRLLTDRFHLIYQTLQLRR